MAYRLYLSKIVGDGITLETAYRSRFSELAEGTGVVFSQIIDKEKLDAAWVVSNLTTAQHNAAVADAGIRHIPKSVLIKKRSQLTAGETTSINEMLVAFGFASKAGVIFTQEATVFDLLRWIFGGTYWDGFEAWFSNATD